ncbi:MAG: prolipoprotein diacylglyceryl transferase family protein, partial [Planctomycetota bacterium]|nr:prolipoprotein diacylglyceryl transferase family protein [Planctomycetota bacterium]
MRSTLFYIPHQIAGVPMLGFGILLALVWIVFIAWGALKYSRTKSSSDVTGALPVVLIASAVLVFLLPSVEQKWPDGTAIGLPIRGYGVMVVAGLFCGVGITVLRAKQLGLSVDDVIGLGFWMMLTGVIGARVFFVVQKWSEFNSITDVFKLTEGGLVIYGGVIGGLLAGITYCWQRNLNVLAMADLIAPGFLIGQSLGRIGCLLHGCCFGGV